MQQRFPQARLLSDEADVNATAKRLGYSWEHTASLIRRKRLLRLRRMTPGSAIVTGHHYSDYRETMALRRERKIPDAFLPALSDRDENTGFLRPLYRLTREEVRGQLITLGLSWFEDPANGDLRFARNRVRNAPIAPSRPPPSLGEETCCAGEGQTRELRLPLTKWNALSTTEQARTTFSAFRRLAIVRKFTRSHFSRAHKLPFALPPFFAHLENSGSTALIIFRRGLGQDMGLPAAETGTFIRGNAVTRSHAIRQPYGKKSVAKIFSEKKLSPRQRRQTLVYLDADSPGLASRIVFPDRTQLSAETL